MPVAPPPPGLPPITIQSPKTWEVRRYRPRLEVTITGRHLQGGTINGVAVDSTPFFFNDTSDQDLISVSTHKDIKDSVGSFVITLTTRRDAYGRTWEHRLNPMDYVEIAMTHDAVGPIPTIMRGFITNVSMTMTEVNGQPEMAVQVQGNDYGKLFIKAQLFIVFQGKQILFGSDANQEGGAAIFWTEFWGLFRNGAYSAKPLDFIDALLGFNATPGDNSTFRPGILASFISLKDAPPMRSSVHAEEFRPNYLVPLQSSAAPLGSVQNLLDAYKASPFYEMFIEERVDGPYLVWRLAPFLDANGALISLGPNLGAIYPSVPSVHDVLMQDIITDNIGHQDKDQYSYFEALPSAIASSNSAVRNLYGEPVEGGGAAIWRRELSRQFGFNPMQISFPLLFTDISSMTQTNALTVDADYMLETKALNQWLEAAFADQYTFENGEVVIRGDSTFHIGEYFRIVETGQTLYIEAVEHSFTIDKISYTTKLDLTRGRWPPSISPYFTLAPDTTTPAGTPGTNLGGNPSGLSAGEYLSQVQSLESNPPNGPQLPINPNQPIGPQGPGGTTGPGSGKWTWPVDSHTITQPFGVTGEVQGEPFHTGIDIAANGNGGGPVYAAVSGTISFVGWASSNHSAGLGFHVEETLSNGWIILYGHMNPDGITVKAGDQVSAKQVLGQIDNTGFSTGPHLHFEIDNPTPTDPIPFLKGGPG